MYLVEGLVIVFLLLLNWEVITFQGNVEFKDKSMLHGFRELKCWCEVGEEGRWERWNGNEVARC